MLICVRVVPTRVDRVAALECSPPVVTGKKAQRLHRFNPKEVLCGAKKALIMDARSVRSEAGNPGQIWTAQVPCANSVGVDSVFLN